MKTRKAHEISGNDDDDTPVAKKLKSSPTDLILLIGEENYEYHCHAVFMARQSDFIDAALASPMRESQTNVIELPDVTPKIWGFMMKIIDSPVALNFIETTMGDVLLAAEKFDKYQFSNGIASCAAKVSSGFEGLAPRFHSDRVRAELKLNSVIKHALQCSNISGLEGAMPAIYKFFTLALSMPLGGKHYFGGLIFKEDQVRRLAPLIVKGRLLGNKFTEAEILCPLFPKFYLNTVINTYEERRFGPRHQRSLLNVANVCIKKSKTNKLKVAVLNKKNDTGPTPLFDGLPTRDTVSWAEDLNISRMSLEKVGTGNWVIGVLIVEEDGTSTPRKLWKCPLSTNFTSFPPRKGWVKVHDSAPDGSLRVELEGKDGIATIQHVRPRPPQHAVDQP